MRVLYLDDIPTPYRLEIHRCFAATDIASYQVLFCASDEPGRSWNLDYTGIEYSILKGWQFRPPGQLNPFSFKINPGVLKKLRQFQPDVVILSGYVHPTIWLAAYWCRRHGIPYGVVSESSVATGSGNVIKGWLKKKCIGPMLAQAAFGLPVSRAAGRHLRKLSGNSELPLFPFPNTPNVARLAEMTQAAEEDIRSKKDLLERGVPGDGRHILFAGRLIGAKRPLDLLQAYQLLPEQQRKKTHLVFVGDGPLHQEVLSARKEGDSVYILGWIKDKAVMARLMASADLFVLPSVHETWGAVVNEAMAVGTPVLASDKVGAAQDMIEHDHNGFLFCCGDIAAFSQALTLALQSTQKEEIIAAAKATANVFGHEYAVNNLRQAVCYAQQGNKINIKGSGSSRICGEK